MTVRLPLAILALAVAFGAGAASARLFEGEARAQSAQGASVYVPIEGLSFRAVDGRIIARLSYDAHGGVFEVYDGREKPGAALRPGLAGAVAFQPPGAVNAPAPPPAPLGTVASAGSHGNNPMVDLGY